MISRVTRGVIANVSILKILRAVGLLVRFHYGRAVLSPIRHERQRCGVDGRRAGHGISRGVTIGRMPRAGMGQERGRVLSRRYRGYRSAESRRVTSVVDVTAVDVVASPRRPIVTRPPMPWRPQKAAAHLSMSAGAKMTRARGRRSTPATGCPWGCADVRQQGESHGARQDVVEAGSRRSPGKKPEARRRQEAAPTRDDIHARAHTLVCSRQAENSPDFRNLFKSLI